MRRRKIEMASLASLVASPSDVLRGPLGAAEAASGGWPHDQQFYRELLQALPAAIYTTDAAGWISFYNEPAVELAGRRPELGSDRWCVSWRLYWPDGTPMAHDECPMAVALREDGPIRGREIIAERPDGTRVAVLPYPTPLHDASGKLVGAVNMLVDISDRKRIENTLRRLNVALTERVEEHAQQLEETAAKLDRTERDFRMLVHSVTDYAIYMLDPEGFITSWNAGAERIKGYREDEIIGQHFSRFYTEKDRASGLPERALATTAREGKYEAEAWRVRKNGERFWASVLIDPIRDDTGELVGFAKVTRDITERRQTQEALA
jgi:PAS domain S-box-containing protein